MDAKSRFECQRADLFIEVFQLNLAMRWPARRQHFILVTGYHKNLNYYEEDQRTHKKLLCI